MYFCTSPISLALGPTPILPTVGPRPEIARKTRSSSFPPERCSSSCRTWRSPRDTPRPAVRRRMRRLVVSCTRPGKPSFSMGQGHFHPFSMAMLDHNWTSSLGHDAFGQPGRRYFECILSIEMQPAVKNTQKIVGLVPENFGFSRILQDLVSQHWGYPLRFLGARLGRQPLGTESYGRGSSRVLLCQNLKNT